MIKVIEEEDVLTFKRILISVDGTHYSLIQRRCHTCEKDFWCVSSMFDGDEKVYFCNKNCKWCICSECAYKHHQQICYGVYIFLMSNPLLRDIVTTVML